MIRVLGNSSDSFLFETGYEDRLFFETQRWHQGIKIVAGVDESGRGPLAGPVVAGAVILRQEDPVPGVKDSKQLSSSEREALFFEIQKRALALGIGVSYTEEIDEINILQASLLAMYRAVSSLPVVPEFVLIDGNCAVPGLARQQTIVKGDARSASISAASIVAKVIRDRMMDEFHHHYPIYDFATNKGYATVSHRRLIARHGPCQIHRKTFKGVREHLQVRQLPLLNLPAR